MSIEIRDKAGTVVCNRLAVGRTIESSAAKPLTNCNPKRERVVLLYTPKLAICTPNTHFLNRFDGYWLHLVILVIYVT